MAFGKSPTGITLSIVFAHSSSGSVVSPKRLQASCAKMARSCKSKSPSCVRDFLVAFDHAISSANTGRILVELPSTSITSSVPMKLMCLPF